MNNFKRFRQFIEVITCFYKENNLEIVIEPEGAEWSIDSIAGKISGVNKLFLTQWWEFDNYSISGILDSSVKEEESISLMIGGERDGRVSKICIRFMDKMCDISIDWFEDKLLPFLQDFIDGTGRIPCGDQFGDGADMTIVDMNNLMSFHEFIGILETGKKKGFEPGYVYLGDPGTPGEFLKDI